MMFKWRYRPSTQILGPRIWLIARRSRKRRPTGFYVGVGLYGDNETLENMEILGDLCLNLSGG
jgi:hypothetical protein